MARELMAVLNASQPLKRAEQKRRSQLRVKIQFARLVMRQQSIN